MVFQHADIALGKRKRNYADIKAVNKKSKHVLPTDSIRLIHSFLREKDNDLETMSVNNLIAMSKNAQRDKMRLVSLATKDNPVSKMTRKNIADFLGSEDLAETSEKLQKAWEETVAHRHTVEVHGEPHGPDPPGVFEEGHMDDKLTELHNEMNEYVKKIIKANEVGASKF